MAPPYPSQPFLTITKGEKFQREDSLESILMVVL